MAWAVLLCLCSWWRWCRGSRLWSLFLFSSVVASSLYFCHLVSLQTILCLSLSRFPPLSLPFSLSPKFLPPLVSFFPFPSPSFVSLAPVFIGSRGEVHHTLYKHRAWWPGHRSSAFCHGGGHGSPVSPLMRV